jgi:hypothetical protein
VELVVQPPRPLPSRRLPALTAPSFSTARCERWFRGSIMKTTRPTKRNAWSSMSRFIAALYRPPQCERARKVQPISTSSRSASYPWKREVPMTRRDRASCASSAPPEASAWSKKARKPAGSQRVLVGMLLPDQWVGRHGVEGVVVARRERPERDQRVLERGLVVEGHEGLSRGVGESCERASRGRKSPVRPPGRRQGRSSGRGARLAGRGGT